MEPPVPRTWPAVAALLASSLPDTLLAAPPKLAPLHLSPNPSRLAGPHGPSAESAGYPSFAYGCSASSYPVNPNAKKQGEKYGDPIADGFMAVVHHNTAVLCVTDGCGWGNKARLASRFALASFVDHVSARLATAIDLASAAALLLDGIKAAHAAVFLLAAELGGLTTLLGGIVLPLAAGGSAFLSINLGDCKCFAWDGAVVYDITSENRGNANNPTDPGGVLGPSDGALPDLRNLRLYFYTCSPKDHIMLVSDGVHDTYDPEARGMQPMECGVKGDAWKDLPSAELEKDRARCKLMAADLARLPPAARNAEGIAKCLVDACVETTKSSRQFMEANPSKRQPQDARLYPGKMDHTSALVFTLGAVPHDALPPPIRILPTSGVRVLISGASGFLGKHLVNACKAKGYTVAKLVRTRPPAESPDVYWDIPNQIVDTDKLTAFGPHVVIHLSGENMFGLWTEWKKKEIYDSRINSTRLLVKTLCRMATPPAVFLSSSGVGAYGRDNGDTTLTEDEKGTLLGWVAQICADWEGAALNLVSLSPTTRVGILRTAVVFDATEGPLTLLTRQSKFGLGGTLGSGTQYMPWITLQDWIAGVLHIIETPSLSGPINLCAPTSVQNTALMQAIGEVVSRPTWFWVPESIARFFAGEMADELLLVSLRCVPRRLEQSGFRFADPEVRAALRHLLLPAAPAPPAPSVATAPTSAAPKSP